MRHLHAVQAHEIFVASGVYRYTRDGTPLDVREQWTMHELSGGATFIRVDEDGRDEDGLGILSEALLSPDDTIERFNVQSFNSKDDKIPLLRANYSFNADYVQISTRLGSDERQHSEFALRENTVIYIKQTIFMGYTIQQVLAQGGEANVFTPQIIASDDSHLLKMMVKERGSESVTIGKREIAATKYQIADNVFYWIDENNVVLKRQYTVDDVPHECILTNYAQRS